MKAGLYGRVSTGKQTTENQLPLLRELAKAKQFEIYAEYIDEDVSGKRRTRPAFDRMMADARAHRFNIILVSKLDRLGRSMFHLFSLIEELNSIGIDVLTLDGRVDTTTPQGKMFFAISAVFADIERDMIAERTKAGLARAEAEAERKGLPFKIGRPPKDVDLNKIASLRANGWGWRRIGKELGVSYQTVRSHVLRKGVSNVPSEKSAEKEG